MFYKRNCPECGNELITNNKYWNELALKENRLCLNCSAKHKIITDEWRENMSKNHADISGKNNPFYGKKHTQEVINKLREINTGMDRFSDDYKQKLSVKMSGAGNHFYGKTHSEETKKILSIPKTKEHKIKLSLSLKGKPSPTKGKIISDETRRRMRVSAINRIKRDRCVLSSMCPSVNKSEIRFFENLEKERGWNGFFYSKNGNKGQFLIEDLGYFVDYYEPNLNIVVEYDETKHYNADWTLKEKDVRRQKEIIGKLGCKFYRYNEPLNILYEVQK